MGSFRSLMEESFESESDIFIVGSSGLGSFVAELAFVAYLAFKADLALVKLALIELALAVVGVAAVAAFFAVVAYDDHLDVLAFVTAVSFRDACLDHYGIVLALFDFGTGLVLDLCVVAYHAR